MADDSVAFCAEDFVDLPGLAAKLKRPTDTLCRFIKSKLSGDTAAVLDNFEGTQDDRPLRHLLVRDFNAIISGACIFEPDRFDTRCLRSETEKLLNSNPKGNRLKRLNRLLLEDAYRLAVVRFQERPFTIEELKARDESAWTRAFAKLSIIGKRLLCRKARARKWPLKEQDIEELVDDAIMEVYEKVASFDTLNGLESYFRRATVHVAIDRLRRAQTKKRGHGNVLVTYDLSDLGGGEQDEARRQKIFNQIAPEGFDWAALDKLLPNVDPAQLDAAHITGLRHLLVDAREELEKPDRKLLAYWYDDQLTQKEIAKRLKKSPKQIGNEINRALERLARILPADLKGEMKELYGR